MVYFAKNAMDKDTAERKYVTITWLQTARTLPNAKRMSMTGGSERAARVLNERMQLQNEKECMGRIRMPTGAKAYSTKSLLDANNV
jgi:hypothetical protein